MTGNILDESFESRPEIISQDSLSDFIHDVKEYDRQHNAGTWAGRSLAGILMVELGLKSGESGGLQRLDEDIHKNLIPKDIYERHVALLHKIGIDIESSNKSCDIDEKEIYAVGELSINLLDKNLYLEFLKTLDKTKLNIETRELLAIMAQKLVRQVQEVYSLDSADERLLELFSGLREIILEYERIGLSEEVSNLKEYQGYLKTGYLKEYISAKNHQIFKSIGEGFNLSTFQRDSTYEYYINRWQGDFFDELEKIKQNLKAKDFYAKVLEYGKACIEFAEKDLARLREKYKDSDSYNVDNIELAIKDTRTKIDALEK